MVEHAEIPDYLGKCEILKVHDDGDLTIKCSDGKYVVTGEGGVFKEYNRISGKPPLYLDIGDKKHKLVGVEKSSSTAEVWAINMREHSGEHIKILESDDGFALYREE